MGTAGGFEKIGRKEEEEEEEKGDLKLEDYLSYDEMQISSLLSLSSPTFFINDGNRNNCASIAKEGTFQKFGVYVGLVGARFEKLQQMESQHMLCIDKIHTEGFFLKKNLSKTLLNKKRKKKERGYGKEGNKELHIHKKNQLWCRLYGVEGNFSSFKEVVSLQKENKKKFEESWAEVKIPYSTSFFFNVKVYKRRIGRKIASLPFLHLFLFPLLLLFHSLSPFKNIFYRKKKRVFSSSFLPSRK